jgi:hypothetical protein
MMVTTPTTGQSNWDVPLNAALNDLQGQINQRQLDVAWTPGDQAYAAWSFDPALPLGSSLVPTGTLNLTRLAIRTARTLNSITVQSTAAGVTLTAGQNFAGLYDSTGARVALTADQSAVWNSTGTKIMNLTAPYAAAAGYYWVALLVNAVTAPQFQRGQSAAPNAINAGLATASSRYATSGAGLTALPASFVPGAVTQSAIAWWTAVK